MKVLILLSLAVCFVEVGFCQADFRKGYIITNTLDTIVGLVDYREGARAHEFCSFKKSKEQSTTKYEPSELIGYGIVDDKFFESKDIPISDGMTKRVFLEAVVKGVVVLYKYGETYFVEKGGNGLHPLTNESKQIFVNGNTLLLNTNHHISTINMLLTDCYEVNPNIINVRLAERSLTNLVEEYNQCHGLTAITYKAKKTWVKSMIGISAGINISQINFANKATGYEYLEGSFGVSKSPTIGISFDVLSPRLNERISFHSDVLYLAHNYYSYSRSESVLFTERNYTTIKLQELKIPMAICYTFPKRNFTPYLNIGVSSTLQLSSYSKWINEIESKWIQPEASQYSVNTTVDEALEIKKIQMGLWLGCGFLKPINNKLNVFMELRLEQTDGISQNAAGPQDDVKSQITNFHILIGLRTK